MGRLNKWRVCLCLEQKEQMGNITSSYSDVDTYAYKWLRIYMQSHMHVYVESRHTKRFIILSSTHLLCTSKDCWFLSMSISVPSQYVFSNTMSNEIYLTLHTHLLVGLCTTSITSVGSNRHDWLHLSASCYNATNRNKLANLFCFYISNRFRLLVSKMFEMNFTVINITQLD